MGLSAKGVLSRETITVTPECAEEIGMASPESGARRRRRETTAIDGRLSADALDELAAELAEEETAEETAEGATAEGATAEVPSGEGT